VKTKGSGLNGCKHCPNSQVLQIFHILDQATHCNMHGICILEPIAGLATGWSQRIEIPLKSEETLDTLDN
jgi:hypothetical protein